MVVNLLPKDIRPVAVNGGLHGTAELITELADKLRLTGLGYIISKRASRTVPTSSTAVASHTANTLNKIFLTHVSPCYLSCHIPNNNYGFSGQVMVRGKPDCSGTSRNA